jgi:hypothetical protein
MNRVKHVDSSQSLVNLGHHPENLANTHFSSNLGQRHCQTLVKPLMSLNLSRTFCRVLQISPKHFKFYQYKICPVFHGTQLSCWAAFQIWSGKWWKAWSTATEYYSPELRKTTTSPAVHAQTVDQNIGQPLQKIISYRCSTTLVFKAFEALFENFEQTAVKHS